MNVLDVVRFGLNRLPVGMRAWVYSIGERYYANMTVKKIVRLFDNQFKTGAARELLDLLKTKPYNVSVNEYLCKKTNLSFSSQLCQDVIAHLYLSQAIRRGGGTVIDIGANDGKQDSNSYLFENLGWEVICVEPNPDVFQQLRENRKCFMYNVALSKEIGEMQFMKASGDLSIFSGFTSTVSKECKKEILKCGGTMEEINVKVLTFDEMMKNHPDLTHINFMSIDVEGAEMDVLASINFSKYTFDLITIENNGHGDKLTGYMASKGYKLLIDIGLDMLFVPK